MSKRKGIKKMSFESSKNYILCFPPCQMNWEFIIESCEPTGVEGNYILTKSRRFQVCLYK